jgi:hypothetical protein
MRTSARAYSAAVVLTILVSALAACGPTPSPMPVPTNSSSGSPSPTPSPSATKIPKFHPDGTAAQNHQFFDWVNQGYWDKYGKGTGQDIVTSLVNQGFVKADMEVTPDTTAINIPADAIIVSVRIQGMCLIGQFGPSQYTSVLAPVLGTGKCLVGVTRPIDF